MRTKPQTAKIRAIVAATTKLSFLCNDFQRDFIILTIGADLATLGIGSADGLRLSNAVKECLRWATQGEPLRWALEDLQALESELIYGKGI